MAVWRPSSHIRVIVIGLVWNAGRLLAVEVTMDTGAVKGVRPLGGGVEFGETREAALRREFLEELGAEISIVGPWHAIENIFEHEGRTGHEMVFAAEAVFTASSLYQRERISFLESDETSCDAAWFDPDALGQVGIELYPRGLEKVLRPSA